MRSLALCSPNTFFMASVISPTVHLRQTKPSCYQQAAMKTEHRHCWHCPTALLLDKFTYIGFPSVLPLWKSSSLHCHPLTECAQAFLRKYFIAHVRIDLQLARQWGMAKWFRKLNQIFWMEIFFGGQGSDWKILLWDSCQNTKYKSRGDKKGKNTQKRLKPNILTSICLSLDAFILVFILLYSWHSSFTD